MVAKEVREVTAISTFLFVFLDMLIVTTALVAWMREFGEPTQLGRSRNRLRERLNSTKHERNEP
jgi:hypothetical protein